MVTIKIDVRGYPEPPIVFELRDEQYAAIIAARVRCALYVSMISDHTVRFEIDHGDSTQHIIERPLLTGDDHHQHWLNRHLWKTFACSIFDE